LDCGSDSQRYYREVILPQFLEMDLDYVRRQSFWLDFKIIILTAYLVLIKSWTALLRRTRSKPAPVGTTAA